jgi:hypothetical protein
VDLPFALEFDKDSEEDLGRGSKGIGHRNARGRDQNKGHRNADEESRSEGGDAMVE